MPPVINCFPPPYIENFPPNTINNLKDPENYTTANFGSNCHIKWSNKLSYLSNLKYAVFSTKHCKGVCISKASPKLNITGICVKNE